LGMEDFIRVPLPAARTIMRTAIVFSPNILVAAGNAGIEPYQDCLDLYAQGSGG